MSSLLIGLVCLTASAERMAEEDILEGAGAHIEEHRKRTIELSLRLPGGEALPAGSKVHIEQQRHAFLFGSNIYWLYNSYYTASRFLEYPEKAKLYEKHFTELFNFCTTAFYWAPYEPIQGQPRHEVTQAVLDWADRHDIRVKGHPLVWNNYGQPRWLQGKSPDEILQAHLDRIERELSRFPGLTWDVVNELARYDRKETRESCPDITRAISEIGPEEFTRTLYEHARKVDPTAFLLSNDYIRTSTYKRTAIDPITDGGRSLLDAIGIQSHMHGGTWSTKVIWDTCERFAAYGKPLHFTEVTLTSGPSDGMVKKTKDQRYSWRTTPAGEERQAREMARFYTILFSHPAVEAITWWDFSDDQAWRGAPAGLLRKDMSPKPAYHALKKLVKEAWWTNETLSVLAGGTVEFRGFYGEYTLSAVLPDGAAFRADFPLRRNTEDKRCLQLRESL